MAEQRFKETRIKAQQLLKRLPADALASACQNGGWHEIVRMLTPPEGSDDDDDVYVAARKQCFMENRYGRLPLHIALANSPVRGGKYALHGEMFPEAVSRLVCAYPEGCRTKSSSGEIPLDIAISKSAPLEVIQCLVLHTPGDGLDAVSSTQFRWKLKASLTSWFCHRLSIKSETAPTALSLLVTRTRPCGTG